MVLKAGKWYRGVLEAAERFMVRWHEDEAQLSRHRRASAVGGARGNGGGNTRRSGWKPNQRNAGRGGNSRGRTEIAVDESREAVADRGVARHQADYNSKSSMSMLLVPQTGWFESGFPLFSFYFGAPILRDFLSVLFVIFPFCLSF